MALIQTLLHYASYLAAFYALYLLAGSLAFGAVLGRRSTASRSASRCRCACVSITSALKAVSMIRTAET
jgi:hypothetical protein